MEATDGVPGVHRHEPTAWLARVQMVACRRLLRGLGSWERRTLKRELLAADGKSSSICSGRWELPLAGG